MVHYRTSTLQNFSKMTASLINEVLDVLMTAHLMDSEVTCMLTPVVFELFSKFPNSNICKLFVDAGWDEECDQFWQPIQRQELCHKIGLSLGTQTQPRNAEPSHQFVSRNVLQLPSVTFRRDVNLSPIIHQHYDDYCSQCSKDNFNVKCEACALVRQDNPAMWSQQKLRQESENLAELYHMPSPLSLTHSELESLAQRHMLPDRILHKLIEYAEYMI